CKSISFDFNNTLEHQEALRNVRTAYKIHEGPLECTLSGTMIFEDASIYQRFQNQSEFSVTARFVSGVADPDTNTNYSIEFTWPKVTVQNFDVAMEAAGVMEVDVEFSVTYDRLINRFGEGGRVNVDCGSAYLW